MFKQFACLSLDSERLLFITAVECQGNKFLRVTFDQFSFRTSGLHQIQADGDDNVSLVLHKDIDVRLLTSEDNQDFQTLGDEFFYVFVE